MNSDDYAKFLAQIFIVSLILVVTYSVTNAINTKIGTTYHGVVVQEVCNEGTRSYVLIEISNQTSQTRNYKVEYNTCLDFLFHHGKGVTITDDAWFNTIAVYRWD